LNNRPTKSKGTGEGGIKEIRLDAKGKILTVDEKTTRDTNKSVTKTV
jgi:hypothetical protein